MILREEHREGKEEEERSAWEDRMTSVDIGTCEFPTACCEMHTGGPDTCGRNTNTLVRTVEPWGGSVVAGTINTSGYVDGEASESQFHSPSFVC
jgi:hypothetical protein